MSGSRRPTFEATELFARGVGDSTDIVQKEMYTLTDGGGRSLTLRPEGTAPVCRAYVEHGMHKLPPAGEAVVPVELLPLRARPGGALPPVLAGRRGGAGLGGPRGRRRVDRAARDAARGDGGQGVRLRLSSLGSSDSRARYRERLQAHLRANEDEPVGGGEGAHRAEPAARVRLRP